MKVFYVWINFEDVSPSRGGKASKLNLLSELVFSSLNSIV